MDWFNYNFINFITKDNKLNEFTLKIANEIIESGKALKKLDELIELSNS